MIRIAISVEGQTEYEFCNKVLTPYFRSHNIEMTPIIVMTSKDKCGRKHKGGCININRIKNEIHKLLPNFDYVTTFYDFYGFSDRPCDDVNELETKIYELFNDKKFIPYIQKYEFETLLFSKPRVFTDYFGDNSIENKIMQDVNQYIDIECINDSPDTAPHKRLENYFPEDEKYDKVFHGEGFAYDIGLETMRANAKRFNQWIEKIVNLKLQIS